MKIKLLLFILLSSVLLKSQQNSTNIVNEFNTEAPYQISKTLRIDKAEQIQNEKIRLYCTIQATGGDEISAKTYEAAAKPLIIKLIQESEIFEKIRDSGISMDFVFSDLEHEFLVFEISSQEYTKPVKGLDNITDLESLLKYLAGQVKQTLPLKDPESGVIIKDIIVGSSMLGYKCELPDDAATTYNRVAYYREIIRIFLVNESIKSLIKDQGVLIKYLYEDSEGNFIDEINITAEDLKD